MINSGLLWFFNFSFTSDVLIMLTSVSGPGFLFVYFIDEEAEVLVL